MPLKTSKTPLTPTITANAVKDEESSLVTPVTEMPTETDKSYFADLAFMNEEVEVMVAPSNDPHDSIRAVSASVNGKDEWFMRGEWKKVKRCYVEVLVRAKREQWQFSYKRAPDGSTQQVEYGTQSQRFPVSVKDINPKGAVWLQTLIKSPV